LSFSSAHNSLQFPHKLLFWKNLLLYPYPALILYQIRLDESPRLDYLSVPGFKVHCTRGRSIGIPRCPNRDVQAVDGDDLH